MPTPEQKTLIEATCSECHSDSRDCGDKRDKLLHYYSIIIAALLAAQVSVSQLHIRVIADLASGTVGALMVLAMLHYRKWHVVYSRSLETMRVLWLHEGALDSVLVRKTWNDQLEKNASMRKYRHSTPLNPFRGTEAATFWAMVFLAFVPWLLLFGEMTRPKTCSGYFLFATAALLSCSLISWGIYREANRYLLDEMKRDVFDFWPVRQFEALPTSSQSSKVD